MKIVIKLDDDLYKSIIGHRCKNMHQQKCDYEDFKNAIEDGIPLDKIRAEINEIELSGIVDEHTLFTRSPRQVKNMILEIIDKYRESEVNT